MIENEADPLRRIPTKHAVDLHAEVGAILRAARLKRGQSLEAVAQQTRIPKRYLEALENDRLDEFPALVYLRGFLQGYCANLDLSFDELWAKIQPPPESVPAAEATAAPAATKPPKPAPHAVVASSAPPHAHETSSATGAIVFALALAAGVSFLIFKDRRTSPAAGAADSSIPRALMPLSRAIEPKIVLRAVDDVWVRVAVDGNVVFEGRIPRGAAMDWKPAHVLTLRTTAATSLQLTVNGAAQALANPTSDGDYRIDVP